MAHIRKDRVLETSTTTGTGALTLAGAVVGFRAFSAVCATNDTVEYLIEAVDSSGVPTGAWETGIGTYSGANTLTRTTVIDSSNAGAAMSFAAGTKVVGIAPIAKYFADLGRVPEAPTTRPRLADFPTSVNNSGMTYTDEVYGIKMYQAAAASFQLRGYFKAPPATPYNIYAKFDYSMVEHGNNCRVGIAVRNSSNSKTIQFGHYFFLEGRKDRRGMQWTTETSYSGDLWANTYPFGRSDWVRVENDGTNLKLYHGDGYEWVLTGSTTIAAFIGTVDLIGFAHQINNPSILRVLSWSTTAPA